MNFKQIMEQKRTEFMSHVRPEIEEIVNSNRIISLQEWKEMRINSYEMKLLEHKLSDEAFIYHFENALKNAGFKEISKYDLSTTYDKWIQAEGIKELLKRLKAKVVRIPNITV